MVHHHKWLGCLKFRKSVHIIYSPLPLATMESSLYLQCILESLRSLVQLHRMFLPALQLLNWIAKVGFEAQGLENMPQLQLPQKLSSKTCCCPSEIVGSSLELSVKLGPCCSSSCFGRRGGTFIPSCAGFSRRGWEIPTLYTHYNSKAEKKVGNFQNTVALPIVKVMNKIVASWWCCLLLEHTAYITWDITFDNIQ